MDSEHKDVAFEHTYATARNVTKGYVYATDHEVREVTTSFEHRYNFLSSFPMHGLDRKAVKAYEAGLDDDSIVPVLDVCTHFTKPRMPKRGMAMTFLAI